MKRLLYLVEHPDRELEIAEAICKNLEANFHIDIFSINFHVWRIIFSKNYDLIIFPSSWPIINHLSKMFPNSQFLSMNFEQMLSTINRSIKAPTGKVIQNETIHFSWSSDYMKFLKDNGVDSKNIFIVEKPLNQILKLRKPLNLIKNRNKYKRIIFIPLTCLQGFKSDKRIRKEFKDEKMIELAQLRRNYVKETLNIIFKWVSAISIKYQEFLLIMRPHPSISTDQYHKLFSELGLSVPKNLMITSEESAVDWILESDAVMTNYSSVVIDAKTLGVNAFLLEPIKYPEFLIYGWFEEFRKINTLDDFENSILYSKPIFSSNQSNNFDGVDRISNHIMNLNLEKKNRKRFILSFHSLFFLFKSLIKHLLHHYFRFFLRDGLKRDYFPKRRF